MKWVFEDIVICLTVVTSLGIALVMSLLLVIGKYPFPPSLITFFAGISVAALIYRFLGGSEDAKLAMGVVQVGGSAAILLGTTFLLGDKISTQIGLFETREEYINEVNTLKSDLLRAQNRNVDITRSLVAAKSQIEILENRTDGAVISFISKLQPTDDLIKKIKRMVKNEVVPFTSSPTTVTGFIQIGDFAEKDGYYQICRNTYNKLYPDLTNASDKITFFREVGDGGNSKPKTLERNGWIEFACKEGSNFNIRLRCGDAKELFPDRIKECRGTSAVYTNGEIRGAEVTLRSVSSD